MKSRQLILSDRGELLEIRLRGDGAQGEVEFARGWTPDPERGGPVYLDEPDPVLVLPASALRGLVASLEELRDSIDWEAFDAGQELLRLRSEGPE